MKEEAKPYPILTALAVLIDFKGVGGQNALKIIQDAALFQLENNDDAKRSLIEHLLKIKRNFSKDTLSDIWEREHEKLVKTYEQNIICCSPYDDIYPPYLHTLPDRPALLYVKGAFSVLHHPHNLALIGTRLPTLYSQKTAQKLALLAVKENFAIINGLAEGCDKHALQSCINANGKAIAVMAHGLDMIYPQSNRSLATSLLEKGGCLVSEYPVGAKPESRKFAVRDRLQSALSDGIFIIETKERGGTMHTVKAALKQKRFIACLNHPENFKNLPQIKGNRILIEQNLAQSVAHKDEFLQYLHLLKEKQHQQKNIYLEKSQPSLFS